MPCRVSGQRRAAAPKAPAGKTFFSPTMTGRHYRSLACLLVALLLVCSSCRPVFGNDSDFEDDEDEPFFKNARDRKLVTTSPTYRSIVKENERHGTDVKQRNFAGPTLGYITPWYVLRRL